MMGSTTAAWNEAYTLRYGPCRSGGPGHAAQFITANRAEIVARCRAKIASRPASRPTDVELEHGVPLFLDQLANTLSLALMTHPAIGQSAARHGNELLQRGFTVAG